MSGVVDRIFITAALGKASLRSEFQYRANAISSVFAGSLFQITGFVVVWIIVDRFNQIGGWSLHEITFLYGMRLTSHGIFYLCFSQLFELDRVLITGELTGSWSARSRRCCKSSRASCGSTASAT